VSGKINIVGGVGLVALAFSLVTPGLARSCEFPEKFGIEQPITEGSHASLVWNGTRYGIAWARSSSPHSDIWFAHLDSSGNMIGEEVRVTTNGWSERPSLAWTGTHWGVAWRALAGGLEIGFAVLDAGGHPVGDPARVTIEEQTIWGGPELAWTGAEFAVAWNGDDDVRLTRLSSTGSILSETQVEDSQGVLESFVWNGNGFAFVSYESPRFWFFRADAEGNPIVSRRQIGEDEFHSVLDDGKRRASIVNGERYGVVMNLCPRSGTCTLALRLVRRSGTPLTLTPLVVGAENPALTWNGTEYGVVWQGGATSGTWFSRISADGFQRGEHIELAPSLSWSSGPRIAWTGSQYGVTVEPASGLNAGTVWFTRVACDCPDSDGDGVSVCSSDCDDSDAATYPGAAEVCDGRNNNCDDPAWPAVPADEIDDDTDGLAECEGDCDDTN